MLTPVKIIIGRTTLKAELFDTHCAQAIAASLPIETQLSEWGDEFYFTIPVNHALDSTATENVKVGDIGYWPPGQALALFFGPTPMSSGADPVPASAVNLVGRMIDAPSLLKNEKGSSKIRIERDSDH
jgi:uncharacterized protein